MDAEYKRTTPMAEREIISICQKYIHSVASKYTLSQAFLFGSYAKGTHKEGSDIDLAIIIKSPGDAFRIQLELMKLRRKFDLRIEPHLIKEADFNTANPFAYEILTSGIEIKTEA